MYLCVTLSGLVFVHYPSYVFLSPYPTLSVSTTRRMCFSHLIRPCLCPLPVVCVSLTLSDPVSVHYPPYVSLSPYPTLSLSTTRRRPMCFSDLILPCLCPLTYPSYVSLRHLILPCLCPLPVVCVSLTLFGLIFVQRWTLYQGNSKLYRQVDVWGMCIVGKKN